MGAVYTYTHNRMYCIIGVDLRKFENAKLV